MISCYSCCVHGNNQAKLKLDLYAVSLIKLRWTGGEKLCFSGNHNVQLSPTDRLDLSVPSFLPSERFILSFILWLEIIENYWCSVSHTEFTYYSLPLLFWDFKANIWSGSSWLIPFTGPIAAFFFILFRPCLFKYLISIIQQSIQALEDSFHKWPPASTLTFRAVQFHLFSLMTHTWTHRQGQLCSPSPPTVVIEETFVPTSQNQNEARSLRINPF